MLFHCRPPVCCSDDAGWTKLPGAELQRGSGEHAGKRQMSLVSGKPKEAAPARGGCLTPSHSALKVPSPPALAVLQEGAELQFVMTNGEGKFDTPNPYGEASKPRNYAIREPGTWLLKDGSLRKLE